MRYSFRLAQLIGHKPDPKRRPGTIKEIAERTGLDRHQVAALLKNEMKYIPLDALSKLCDFLVEKGYAQADQLPGALFAVETENFWEMLARRRRLELCAGVRRADPTDVSASAWVVASDSVLLGELLNGVSTLGGTAKYHGDGSNDAGDVGTSKPHPEHIQQSLVLSPGPDSGDEVMERANRVYGDFGKAPNDKALICVGSVKSNPVVELIISSAFGGEAFQSEAGVASATDRNCPFMLRYRDNDPHFESNSGGLDLAQDTKADKPGFYYETEKGTWKCVEWNESSRDAALVFYIFRESQGSLEMVLSGFSGRATRLLSRTICDSAENFWPPVYKGQGLQIGAYVVQYKFKSSTQKKWDVLDNDLEAEAEVTPLSSAVIERRIDQFQDAKPTNGDADPNDTDDAS